MPFDATNGLSEDVDVFAGPWGLPRDPDPAEPATGWFALAFEVLAWFAAAVVFCGLGAAAVMGGWFLAKWWM